MLDKIIFATGNKNKVVEIREILADSGIEIVTMKEAGIQVEIEENGKTFEENALIKARTIAKISGEAAMADDSGLVVDYLNGEPGIYSARYMGHDTSYDVKNDHIIELLKEAKEEERTARFVCAMALVLPDGRETTRTGVMEGTIAHEKSGKNGFGYDPIFFLPQYGKTSADISSEEKNTISHRGQAVRAMKKVIEDIKMTERP